jgi:hypothetical protein
LEGLVNRSNELNARFGGVRAPIWDVVFGENAALRNIRTKVNEFVQEIDFINKSITSFRTTTKVMPLYFSPDDKMGVMIMHNAWPTKFSNLLHNHHNPLDFSRPCP